MFLDKRTLITLTFSTRVCIFVLFSLQIFLFVSAYQCSFEFQNVKTKYYLLRIVHDSFVLGRFTQSIGMETFPRFCPVCVMDRQNCFSDTSVWDTHTLRNFCVSRKTFYLCIIISINLVHCYSLKRIQHDNVVDSDFIKDLYRTKYSVLSIRYSRILKSSLAGWFSRFKHNA